MAYLSLDGEPLGMVPMMAKTNDGNYFLDADPLHFAEILNYLRYGELFTQDSNLLRGVKNLANYLELSELVKEIGSREDDDFDLLSEMIVQWEKIVNLGKKISESIRSAWRKKKESVKPAPKHWGTFEEIYFSFSIFSTEFSFVYQGIPEYDKAGKVLKTFQIYETHLVFAAMHTFSN